MFQHRRWNPRKFSIFVGLIIFSCTIILGLGSMSPTQAADKKTYKQVIVENGDTLWGLAVRYVPGNDPRMVIDEIINVNELNNATISPGQVLDIPVTSGT